MKLGSLLLAVLPLAVADPIFCDSSNKCPEDLPYCSSGLCNEVSAGYADCNPMGSFNASMCKPQPRMTSFNPNFYISSEPLAPWGSQYSANASDYDWVYLYDVASGSDGGVILKTENDTQSAHLTSTKYLWYGKVGANINVSSTATTGLRFSLKSNVGDKVSHAISLRGESYSYYELDWNEDYISLSTDGSTNVVINRNETWNETSQRYDFLSTPATVNFELVPNLFWVDPPSEDSKKLSKQKSFASVRQVSIVAYDLPSFANFTDNFSGNAFVYNSDSGDRMSVELVNEEDYIKSNNGSFSGASPTATQATTSSSNSGSLKSSGFSTILTKMLVVVAAFFM